MTDDQFIAQALGLAALASNGEVALLPTHHCFDDALDYVEVLARANGPGLEHWRYRVVHAVCLAPAGRLKGEQFAHAWVEESTLPGRTLAWQASLLHGRRIYHSVELAELEAELRPQAIRRYSLHEVSAWNRRTGTYGPWEEPFLTLCAAKGADVVYGKDEDHG